ncbi:MAG: DEAD/DEAH box helicase [Planctomycetes bacterium]|nr:DEAD/DEAH box helicase [Planctomycetota bacterium]
MSVPLTFADLKLEPALLKALAEQGYERPTPVQSAAIPFALHGRDVLALAQTGTGKTAAFALPILQRLHLQPHKQAGAIRVLVLAPTRELALQIHESFTAYGRHLKLRAAVILGGVPMGAQIRELKHQPDILVATPGRLLDLHSQGHVRLQHVEVLVLDEADRMLDMGFIHDVRRIVAMVPRQRQTLFFSATMPPAVAELAQGLLHDAARVEVAPSATVAVKVEQRVMFVERNDKLDLLLHLLAKPEVGRTLVFARTRHRADRVVRLLSRHGVAAGVIHSDKTQGARQRALAAFASGDLQVLIATDIMARGIDVEGITHVVNYDMPDDPESHVHRIGRTARAGAQGTAISFCDDEEVSLLRDVERLTRLPLVQDANQPWHADRIARMYSEGVKTSRTRAQRPQGQPRPKGQHRPGGQSQGHGAGRKRRRGGGQGQGGHAAQGHGGERAKRVVFQGRRRRGR